MRNLIPLLILLLSFFHLASARAEGRTFEENLVVSLHDLKSLDTRYERLRFFGSGFANFFQIRFVAPYQEPGKYYIPPLTDLLNAYDSNPPSESLTLAEATDATNLFLEFIAPEKQSTILIDVQKGTPVLYRSMYQYATGLLFALKSLQMRDLDNSEKIAMLRRLITARLSGFFNSGGGGPSSVSKWDMAYFSLMYAYHSGYPANLMENAARAFASIASDKSIEGFQRVAASSLLLELSMVCYSVCTAPTMAQNSLGARNSNDYLKSIFYICDRDCSKSYLNPRAAGFYRAYLNILRQDNDPALQSVRSKLIFDDIKSYFLQIKVAYEDIRAGNTFRAYFWMLLEQTFTTLKLLLLVVLFVFPGWVILLVSAFGLLAFKGELRFEMVKFSSIPVRSKYKAGLLIKRWLVRPLKALFLNLWKILKTASLNLKIGFDGTKVFWNRVGYNLFVVSITLCVTQLRSALDIYN